jgi:hypothetical protein
MVKATKPTQERNVHGHVVKSEQMQLIRVNVEDITDRLCA